MRGGSEPGAAEVERLVDRVAGGEAGDPRWSALLVVLTAAARGSAVDPAREQAAVSAFRAAATVRSAGAARPAQGGRRRRRSLRSARALAGGLVAVFALCGVAVAAGAGVLPARGHVAHGGPPRAPAARTAAPAPATGAPSGSPLTVPGGTAPQAPVSRTPATGAPPPPHTRVAVPPHAVKALCRVYAAAVRDGRPPAAKLTARLQREAGGSRRVAAYCNALLAATSGAAAK
ncbi:hypothetical protein [Actinacidiphila paucisporea]|uniref:Uncharacterized protein n=1 Tax=Actinacidiphila paucisporea TaxID=310782 RepID=A0A1M7ANU3_9ACTN|nr:hypothetical protein [Actinacidiphila paucisporea]SHL44327.1 hypothetical protein SAMN05216499_104151 [Actinacidiphila paucisporea]